MFSKSTLVLTAGLVLGAAPLAANADTIDIGSASGNAIQSEIVAFGWIRSDTPGSPTGGETSFIGTSGTSDFRGFIAFDLSAFSVGDTINTATVSLFVDPQANASGGFNANGDSTVDANAVDLNITSLAEVTGYGNGFSNPATLDSNGTTSANFTNLSPLYGGVLASVELDLDNIADGAEVQLDITAALQAAVDAGASKVSFGLTSPDAIATGARNFFAFQGVSDELDGVVGPNLNVDFTPVPEPGSLALLGLGGLALLRRRR